MLDAGSLGTRGFSFIGMNEHLVHRALDDTDDFVARFFGEKEKE